MENSLESRIYVRELDEHWAVGTAEEVGLPVAGFEGALEVAEAWLRVTGGHEIVIVHADGRTRRYGQDRWTGVANGDRDT